MDGLDNIDRNDRFGSRREVTRVAQEWMDDRGYDLDNTSIDQEIELCHQLYDMLKQQKVVFRDLPGSGRLIIQHRIDRLATMALKRWRQQDCKSMPYPLMEYVRQGMIWPVETQDAYDNTVANVKQIEQFIQSINGINKVCKDGLYDAGVMYVKTLNGQDKQQYIVIRLSTAIATMLSTGWEAKYHHPTAPYIVAGIKFMHNLYEKPSADGPTSRPGVYNIPGIPQKLHHINPERWPQFSVMGVGSDYGDTTSNTTTVEQTIKNIEHIVLWAEEHIGGINSLTKFDF